MSLFERALTVWVFLIGSAQGAAAPSAFQVIASLAVVRIANRSKDWDEAGGVRVPDASH